jgi:hypothetical protein
MPSRSKAARPSLRPDRDFENRRIPITRQPSRCWFRVHKTGAPAVWFGTFPYHRFSHLRCPYPLLYLGATIQTCLWEVFGDDILVVQPCLALFGRDGVQARIKVRHLGALDDLDAAVDWLYERQVGLV